MTSLKRHLGNGPLTISVAVVLKDGRFLSFLFGCGWVTTEGNIVLWHLEQL